jgi:hypothetical protein
LRTEELEDGDRDLWQTVGLDRRRKPRGGQLSHRVGEALEQLEAFVEGC